MAAAGMMSNAIQRAPSQLLQQQPSALKLIQLELDCCHFLCRLGIGSLDRPKHLTSLAHQHDAEPAFHPLGKVFSLGRWGGMAT